MRWVVVSIYIFWISIYRQIANTRHTHIFKARDWIGLDLFNDATCPREHISRPTQVGSLTVYNLWPFISDRRIRLLGKIPLCKSRESSQRGSSKSQQCSIHPEFPAELHIPRACGQWSTSVHNDGKKSSGKDMGLRGLGITNSKPGDDNLLSSG